MVCITMLVFIDPQWGHLLASLGTGHLPRTPVRAVGTLLLQGSAKGGVVIIIDGKYPQQFLVGA